MIHTVITNQAGDLRNLQNVLKVSGIIGGKQHIVGSLGFGIQDIPEKGGQQLKKVVSKVALRIIRETTTLSSSTVTSCLEQGVMMQNSPQFKLRAYCGDIDITGFRRPASYYREIVFGLRREPYLTVQNPEKYGQPLKKTPWVISDAISSWTCPGFEGKPVVVEIYAPGDEVELFLNGRSVGRKAAGKRAGFITHYELAYEPGRLEAAAYENDVEIGRTALETAEGSEVLRVQAEYCGYRSAWSCVYK